MLKRITPEFRSALSEGVVASEGLLVISLPKNDEPALPESGCISCTLLMWEIASNRMTLSCPSSTSPRLESSAGDRIWAGSPAHPILVSLPLAPVGCLHLGTPAISPSRAGFPLWLGKNSTIFKRARMSNFTFESLPRNPIYLPS